MALLPNYSNRLSRDVRGEIMEITITDMPTKIAKIADVVEDDAAMKTRQQDEEEVEAQYTPTSSEQGKMGQQLDARQLATAMKLNKTTYSEYESEDEDDAGTPTSEVDDDDDEGTMDMHAHDSKSAKTEAKLRAM